MKTELEIKMEINDGEKPNLPNRRKSTPKIVTFGGRMHDIISEFDKGNSKPFDEILDQLKDEDLDHRKMNKLIVEVRFFSFSAWIRQAIHWSFFLIVV